MAPTTENPTVNKANSAKLRESHRAITRTALSGQSDLLAAPVDP